QQWYLDRISAPAAWDVVSGNPSSVVAVLDVGVDLDHPDLTSAIWANSGEVAGNGIDDDRNGYIDDVRGWDFVDGDADPSPEYDIAGSNPRDLHHGTLVAGIIAARGNNGEGVAGIDWLAKIMPLRVLHSDGSGDVDAVIHAIRYAIDKGASIINLSFVGEDRSPELDDLIAEAEAKGVLVVAAGGNEDRRGQGDLNQFPVYPICAGGTGASVLGVAATNRDDGKATFSSYGRCVDIAAPGERMVATLFHDPNQIIIKLTGSITTATFGSPYGGFFSGTSFAAPIIAGAASLIRGILPAARPSDVTRLLQTSADPVHGNGVVTADQLGAGRVNLARAVTAAREQATAVPSASGSRVTVSVPLASIADTVTVRAEARSIAGSALSGRAVVFRSNRSSDVLAPSTAVTDGSGIATATIRATEEGIAEITATIDQQLIGSGRAVFARVLDRPIGVGSLLRGRGATVYLIASDGKRYAFPDAQTFRSWYADDGGVQRVSDTILAAFPLGGLATIRPGTFLVKIQTDPKVYAVESGGTLRGLPSEEVARALFGPLWNRRILDVPDAFFATYRMGSPVSGATFPDGSVLEDTRDGERYLIAAGVRRRFTSMIAFLRNGFQLRDVIRVPAVAYPDGTPIADREPVLAQPVP
ncbi:MAG: S8 family serine peptidase, partial [bacterium]|nr:S8 family serine peptidase [bacterium]